MKKMLSLLLSVVMALSIVPITFAEETPKEPAGYLTMSVEASTLGLGFIEEPTKVPFFEGENVAQVFARFLDENDRYCDYTGDLETSFYLSQIQTDWTEDEMNTKMNIPQCLLDAFGTNQEDYIATGGNGDGTLGEFSYGQMTGWMITSASAKSLTTNGVSQVAAVDGDVIRWQFSLEGYGGDLGYANDWGNEPAYLQPDKDALYALLGAINADATASGKLDALLAADSSLAAIITSLNADQATIDAAVASIYAETGVSYDYIAAANADKTIVPTLEPSEPSKPADPTKPTEPTTPTVNQAALDKMEEALDYIYSVVPAPSLGTNGGEWAIIALGRSGYEVSDTYYDDYVARIAQSMIDNNGVLHKYKKTEHSRVIMALSAIGVEPFSIGDYDVTAALSNFDDVVWQGINGATFALIALDTNHYAFAENADATSQSTRKNMIEYLLSKEISGGGFALSGSEADPDMTSMTLQALSSYKDGNDLLKAEFDGDEAGYNALISNVNGAIDRGISALSALQEEDGDFASWDSVNAESTAQAIVALTSLGIHPDTDERFITESGKTLLDGLLKYSDETGGFKHTATGNVNQMATEQSTYALVAYSRFLNGENGLYDMTDAFDGAGTTPPTPQADVVITTPDKITGEAGTQFNAVVTANKWTESTLKLIDGVYTIPAGLEVADVTMGSSVTGGNLQFNLADGKLRFAYMGDNLSDISLTSQTFPLELMTITLKLTEDVSEETSFVIVADDLSLKSESTTEGDSLDVETAKDSVTATVPAANIEASARVLYTGDDTDLISSAQQAVAVEFVNLKAASSVMFGEVSLLYSAEMTAKKGVDTYVAIVDDTVTLDALNDIENYAITAETPADITFADVNEDAVVNAQDALDTLSFWLRKTEVETSKDILRANVNADGAITTLDVLAIMEAFVNARELDVIGK